MIRQKKQRKPGDRAGLTEKIVMDAVAKCRKAHGGDMIIAWIAGFLGVSPSSVRYHLRKLGMV